MQRHHGPVDYYMTWPVCCWVPWLYVAACLSRSITAVGVYLMHGSPANCIAHGLVGVGHGPSGLFTVVQLHRTSVPHDWELLHHSSMGYDSHGMQAGVALGLTRMAAVRFPHWGAEFQTLMATVIVANLIIGPPLFRAAIVTTGESRMDAHNKSAAPSPTEAFSDVAAV